MVLGYFDTATGDFVRVTSAKPLPVTQTPSSGSAATVTEGSCIPSNTTTPKALASSSTLVSTVTMYARQGSRTGNTAVVYWGFTSADGTQQKPLLPGDTVTISAPSGKLLDISTIYVEPTSTGDGVQWVAMV